MRYLALFLVCLSLFGWLSPVMAQEPEPQPQIIVMEQPKTSPPFSLPINPDLYIIRPGDELQITFVQSQLNPMKLQVNPEGQIVNKTLGAFELSFKTLTEARQILGDVLKDLYNIPGISISITASRKVTINVTGAVEKPGTYEAFTSQRVSEVISLAGGIVPDGSRRWILFSGGPNPLRVDLDRAIFLGDLQYDPGVYAGQLIYVPNKSANTVQVAGEVQVPREIELVPGDDLELLLSMAGGVRRKADVANIQIIGRAAPGTAEAIKAGDIIYVPVAPDPPQEAGVSVFGAVVDPGRVSYRSGMTLGDALKLAGGPAADANVGMITVFRRPRLDANGRFTYLRYPVLDPSLGLGDFTNLKLDVEDSVFVPVRVGFVQVEGAVKYPGNFPFREGKDAMYYIQLAGGFLPISNREQIGIRNGISRITSVGSPATIVIDGAVVTVDVREELK